MGFNISGLVINKNYQKNINELFDKLGWSLKKGEEIDFETASSNWKEEEYCDVYFSENGTLLFLNIDYCTEGYSIENLNTLSFGYSEASMTFLLSYCENGIETRTIMETEGKNFSDEGVKLEIENGCDDLSEIIWKQIEIVLGKNFHEIDNSEKAIRYYFSDKEQTEVKQSAHFEQKNHANEVIDISTESQLNKYDFELPIPKEFFTSEYSDSDLMEKFDEQIDYAKKNSINIFFYPWAHGDDTRRFMNFFSLIEEIRNRPHILKIVSKSLPSKDRFGMLCKFNPDGINEKDNLDMIKFINSIKSISKNDTSVANNKVENKWWEFWK